MTYGTINPFGTSPNIVAITVPLLSKIALRTTGVATYQLGVSGNPNVPPIWGAPVQFSNGQIVLGTYTTVQPILVSAGSASVQYDIGTAPNVVLPIVQPTPVAKTTSALLTVAELIQLALTVNQGGAGTSALQLPLATSMDTQFPDWVAADGFDFTLTNISTVAAEDASITTNTGWTLIGDMDVASNAAATDKSAGLFRVYKTAAGAWTILRRS